MRWQTLRKSLHAFACLTLCVVCLATPARAIEVAGELFVDLDAATFTTGDTIVDERRELRGFRGRGEADRRVRMMAGQHHARWSSSTGSPRSTALTLSQHLKD